MGTIMIWRELCTIYGEEQGFDEASLEDEEGGVASYTRSHDSEWENQLEKAIPFIAREGHTFEFKE